MYCIVYICNNKNNYIDFLKNSIKTLYYYNRIDTFVLTNKYIYKLPLNIKQIDINKYLDFINIFNNIKTLYDKIVFFKLYIPFLCELAQYDKILYIDVDTEIYQKLNNIFLTQFNTIAAVNTIDIKYLKYFNNNFNIETNNYFNTGVLLFNKQNILKIYSQDLYICKIKNILKKYLNTVFKYADQDIINILFDNIYNISNEYNYEQSTTKNFNLLNNNCYIKHYTVYSNYLIKKINKK